MTFSVKALKVVTRSMRFLFPERVLIFTWAEGGGGGQQYETVNPLGHTINTPRDYFLTFPVRPPERD